MIIKIRRHNGVLIEHTIDGVAQPLSDVQYKGATGTRPPKPGDLLARIIKKITGETGGRCACNAHKAQMNKWGWWGCWRERKTIIGWLCEEAAKRGHPIDKASAMALFKAALKELRT